MTDLTEKNLENVLLNLTKTDKPITIKPTTWFGNPAKTAQWYTCPKCAEQSPLTLEWVGLSEQDINELKFNLPDLYYWVDVVRATEKRLKEKNT
jgi:hypothetical protein